MFPFCWYEKFTYLMFVKRYWNHQGALHKSTYSNIFNKIRVDRVQIFFSWNKLIVNLKTIWNFDNLVIYNVLSAVSIDRSFISTLRNLLFVFLSLALFRFCWKIHDAFVLNSRLRLSLSPSLSVALFHSLCYCNDLYFVY